MDSTKKAKWSWALYDWANSAFSTTVMAAFFPLFLKDYWSTNQSVTESTWYLAIGNSTASIIVAALAHYGRLLKEIGRWLFLCTLLLR